MENEEKDSSRLKQIAMVLARYWDDLMLLLAGVCFVVCAGFYGGVGAAFGICGVCLTVYAVLVARAKRGR